MKPSRPRLAVIPFVALVAVAPLACSDDAGHDDDDDGAGGKADDIDTTFESGIAVTASSVQALQGDLSAVVPAVDDLVIGGGLATSTYLRPMGPVGPYGPIGPYGPLGVLGPVGSGAWTPQTVIGLGAPWNAFADALTDVGGPLSAKGPLGSKGPLSRAYWDALAKSFATGSDFVLQLETGGLFAPLGPLGPLGALGPLGPLGPVGAHGYLADDDGNWTTDGDCHHDDEVGICRTVDVPWKAGQKRTYELFERYGEAFAAAMPDNDTSFMVEGTINDGPDVFVSNNRTTQAVTIVAFGSWTMYPFANAMGLLASSALIGYATPTIVPGIVFPFNLYDHARSFDDVDVTVEVELDGRTVATLVSDTTDFVDWVHVQVPAGAVLRTHVDVASSWWAPWRAVAAEYRLFVVGSTAPLVNTRVAGPHQLTIPYSSL